MDVCQDCGVKAKTFRDANDGGLYCAPCWRQFYGKEPEGEELPEQLPEDAPRGHPAHGAVKYQAAKKVFSFQWQSGGLRIPFQTTVPAAGNSKWAAEVIARACYMKFEQGWEKERILEWRNQCYSRLGGRPPSLLTSQARSRRFEKLESKLPEPKEPEKAKQSRLRHRVERPETFLPPQELKQLLDDPQTLPKEVKIRSQGLGFSQNHSQELERPVRRLEEKPRSRTPKRQTSRPLEVEGDSSRSIL